MNEKQKRYVIDLAERTFFTFLQGGLSVITVEMFDLPYYLVPPIAAGLAVLKGFVAKKVSPNTAAILPDEADTPKPDPNA